MCPHPASYAGLNGLSDPDSKTRVCTGPCHTCGIIKTHTRNSLGHIYYALHNVIQSFQRAGFMSDRVERRNYLGFEHSLTTMPTYR